MKTASFIGVILPQAPVHLAQILGSYFIGVILTRALVHLTQILYEFWGRLLQSEICASEVG